MIPITEELAIDSDAHQWKLCKLHRATEKTPEHWGAFKFYTSFSQLQEALRGYLLRTSEYESFADLEKNLRAINKLLEKRFRTL